MFATEYKSILISKYDFILFIYLTPSLTPSQLSPHTLLITILTWPFMIKILSASTCKTMCCYSRIISHFTRTHQANNIVFNGKNSLWLISISFVYILGHWSHPSTVVHIDPLSWEGCCINMAHISFVILFLADFNHILKRMW